MKHYICILLGFVAFTAQAQNPIPSRVGSGLDAGFAFKKDNYVPTLTYFQLLNIGGRKRLVSVGWTARLAKFHGDNLNFYTAPANLTRGATGFDALGPALKATNIDTVRFDYVTNTSINFGVRAEVHLGPVDLGGSADVFGLAFGKTRVGRVISSGTYAVNGAKADSILRFTNDNRFQRLRPTGVNVRLLGDNDIGNLAAELYARVRINQRLAIKAGYQWQTAEMYIRDRDIRPTDGNRRYRHRVGMPFVAVTLPFFN